MLKTLSFIFIVIVSSPIAQAAMEETILVIPFHEQPGTPQWTSVAIAQQLEGLLAEHNQQNFITLKQLDAVLRRRDLTINDVSDPEVAIPIARTLGASQVVLGNVRFLQDNLFLYGQIVDTNKKTAMKHIAVHGPMEDLPTLIKKVAFSLLSIPNEIPIMTNSIEAMQHGVFCSTGIIHTPLGPRAPLSLSLPSPQLAIKSCKKALKADPQYALALTSIGLYYAQDGDLEKGIKLSKAAQKLYFCPLAYLIEAYIARQQNFAEQSYEILEHAVKERPGFLHALGYMGESNYEREQYQKALDIFHTYVKQSPRHPWALAQMGKVLARLGKHNKAVKITNKALQYNPDDPELLIEVASRYIDANMDTKAHKMLNRALQAYPLRATALLRIGYIYMRKKQLSPAITYLNKALHEAWREDEWRVRALAQADLARLAGLERDYQRVLDHMRASYAEGPFALPCNAQELKDFANRQEFQELCGGIQ